MVVVHRKGVKAIILNDTWFAENVGTYSTQNFNSGFMDNASQALNAFNTGFYTYGNSTDASVTCILDGSPTGLATQIQRYGQVIGCVVAENIELARYVSEQLSENLLHIAVDENLVLVDTYDPSSGAPIFDPSSKLSDNNTMSRINNQAFGWGGGRLAGPTRNNVDGSYNKLVSGGIIDASSVNLPQPGYYTLDSDGLNRVYPNYENEAKGAYYATGNLIDTLGNGINPDVWVDPGFAATYGGLNGFTAFGFFLPSNNYMDTSYNNDTWVDDASYGNYSGSFITDSQAAYPMEPNSFTIEYVPGNTLNVHMGSQDTMGITMLRAAFNTLFPQYKSYIYDSSGSFIGNSTLDKYTTIQYSTGGSFGSKFFQKYYAKLEVCILSSMVLRKPIKYMEHWKFSEYNWSGRYNSIERTSMSVDRVNKKIDSLVVDHYKVAPKNSPLIGIGNGQSLESSIKCYYIQNLAMRSTFIQQNLPEQFATRGFEQAEGCALGQMNMSKAAALLDIPHYLLTLNQMTYVENRYNADLSYGSANPTNLRTPMNSALLQDANTLLESTTKEQLIAILKNLKLSDSTLDLSGVINDASGNVPRENIIQAFGQYYDNNVGHFNNTNKFKKRGMSIVPHAYTISQGFNNNFQCKLSINYYDDKIMLDLPVIDHGTGSYDKGVQILADTLKISPDIITYVSSSSQTAAGLSHPGSNGTVSVARAVINGSKNLLQEMLSRYPVNANYFDDAS